MHPADTWTRVFPEFSGLLAISNGYIFARDGDYVFRSQRLWVRVPPGVQS
ncbi:hypothetical protein IH785_10395 [candidate division KSB1 bacterium]|nr:hypothetical protein [candidate division KSB1 bacterium]